MNKAIKRVAVTFALGFGLVGAASAAVTTISGVHTTFSFDDALVGLFGKPSVSGDTIFFTPGAFAASAMGKAALRVKNASFNVTVSAKDGYVLNGIDLTESGNYLLYRPRGRGDLGVDLTGDVSVRDLASLKEVKDDIATAAPMTKSSNRGIGWWTANADTSFAAWQSKAVSLTIENLLAAYTDTTRPSWAFIDANYLGASVLVTAVPEPETYAMFLAGLGLIGLVIRRRI